MEEKQMINKTDRGWVDLSNLVYFNSGKTVDWNKSIGKTIEFQYDDIVSTLTITGRTDNIQYVYIDIPGYVQHHRIYVGQIRHGQLGSVVKRITADFKYEVNSIISNLLITSRYRHKGYKYYNYHCLIDDFDGVIREDHLARGHGCPLCKNSIGEKRVMDYLIKNKIKFSPQHTFKDCKDRKTLPFDFYLPDYNACIEYDGIQHFKPVDFAGKGELWSQKLFEINKRHDDIKNQYCKNNNISLCRIKYTENIDKSLNIFFNNLLYTSTIK